MVHKAAWDLVGPRESKEALGQLDLKELREFKESKEVSGRRGSKEALDPQGLKEVREFKEW